MNNPAASYPDAHQASLRRTALITANLAAFLTPFMSSAINVALPSIGKEFAMSAVALGWVATAFMLLAAMCLVPLGRIADLVGRKRIFAAGLGVHTAATVLAALAPSGSVLIVAR
jgi:MFS family permease